MLRAALEPSAVLAFFAWHKQPEPVAALLRRQLPCRPLDAIPARFKPVADRRWCRRGIRECDESPVREGKGSFGLRFVRVLRAMVAGQMPEK